MPETPRPDDTRAELGDDDATDVRPREPVKKGDLVAGKYRIERVLGSSGMGIVYLATHVSIGQQVAIKFLLEGARNKAGLVRFHREARAMAKVKSEHVVRIVDVGELDVETPFIVMDYLQGRDLGQLMREMGTVPLEFTCDVLLQVCEALAAAHAAGVIHRDLKPSNIFLAQQSDGTARVKVIDFGVAKLREDTERADNVTSTSTLVGSPRYMSPEHVTGTSRTPDQRSDVWAIGVIMQEMLTGRRVFSAVGVGPLLVMIATQPPADVAEIMPGLAPGIVDLIRRTLVKDPAQRTPNVATFAEALAPFAVDGPVRAARVRTTLDGKQGDIRDSVRNASWGATPISGGVPSLTPAPVSTSSFQAQPKPGSRTLVVVAAVLGAAVAILALLIGVRFVHSTRASAAPPPAALVQPPALPSASANVNVPAPPPLLPLESASAPASASASAPVPARRIRAGVTPAPTSAPPTTTAPAPAATPRPAATASSRFD